MKKLLLATFSLAVASSAGFAADLPSKKKAPVAAAACSSSWAVSARGWLTQHDVGQSDRSLPLYGASASYTPDTCSGITYSLTSLYGKSGTFRDARSGWNHEYRRFDTELIAQIPWVNNFSFNVGTRYINFKNDTNNLPNGGTSGEKYTSNVLLAELGLAYKAQITSGLAAFASVNYLIGNTFAGLTRTGPVFAGDSISSGGMHGFDASLGLAYVFDANWTSSLRYRYTGLSDAGFRGGMNLMHIKGPELNLTYRF